MNWKKPSVLMLGWEYPPYVNGGLGIACQGLAQALAPFVDITMIVPKVKQSQEIFSLIGLNTLEKTEASSWDTSKEPSLAWETIKLEVELDPYENMEFEMPSAPAFLGLDEKDTQAETSEETTEETLSTLYGSDLYLKVKDYARLAEEVALDKTFDLIHAHDWMTFPAALAIQKATGKPLVLHIHSTEIDRIGEESRGWAYQIEKEALAAADSVITVSKLTANVLKTFYEVENYKMKVVHNATSPFPATPFVKPFPEKLVTFLGRVSQQKNPDTFLQMALKVMEQFDNVRFVMAGTGTKLPYLMEEVAKMRIGHKFHFTGFLDRQGVNKLLSMTDVFVLPSHSDPFGISALEAGSLGVPCIISRNSGVLEVMKGAFTAESQDADLMAEYVLTLLTYPEMGKEIGAEIQASVKALSWSASAQKVLEVYTRMLKKVNKQ